MTCHDFGAPTVWNNYGVSFKCHDRDQVLTKPELSSPLDSLAFLIRNIQTNFIYRYHPPDYNDVVKIPIGAFNIRVYELQRSGNFLGKCSSNNCLSPPPHSLNHFFLNFHVSSPHSKHPSSQASWGLQATGIKFTYEAFLISLSEIYNNNNNTICFPSFFDNLLLYA